MHPRSESGLFQRSPAIPDAETKSGCLVDISILIRRPVEEIIEKALSRLAVAIVPMERRMRSKRDEGKLSGRTLVSVMGFRVHERIPER
jgi:hypothetical protein